MAEALRRNCGRSTDLLARYGGEEFVAFLTGASAIGAARVAENMRSGVESLGVVHAGSSVASVVTVSIGVMCSPSTERIKIETLFRLADEALYQSKCERNVVTMTSSPATVSLRPAI